MLKLCMVVVCSVALVSPASASELAATPKPKLDRKHPDFVRCVKIEETGSLVRQHKVCKSNAEWARIRERQSTEASDMVERQRVGFSRE